MIPNEKNIEMIPIEKIYKNIYSLKLFQLKRKSPFSSFVKKMMRRIIKNFLEYRSKNNIS